MTSISSPPPKKEEKPADVSSKKWNAPHTIIAIKIIKPATARMLEIAPWPPELVVMGEFVPRNPGVDNSPKMMYDFGAMNQGFSVETDARAPKSVFAATAILLFFFSLYLTFSNITRNLSYYSLTNYNFFSNLTFDIDILNISVFMFFGISGVVGTLLLLTYGLKFSRNSPKRRISTYFGYFMLFFLYQAFWLASLITVLFRRKLKWQ